MRNDTVSGVPYAAEFQFIAAPSMNVREILPKSQTEAGRNCAEATKNPADLYDECHVDETGKSGILITVDCYSL